MITTILTHPGGAHKDEFLACSVLLARHAVPIVRREPVEADLADSSVCVVDVGGAHDPSQHNFDHHHFPKDHPPACALTLVLQHLGLYEDARLFCDWLEAAEWFDCRGPGTTAQWLGVDRKALDQLISPIDITVLRRFAQARQLNPGEPLWEIMRMIGEDLLTYVQTLRERLDFIARHAEIWEVETGGMTCRTLFLPRTDPLPDEPSFGLDRYLASQGIVVAGLIYPDRRGAGYGLSRFQDDPRLDFTRIASHPEVHFAHARGFVAKTSATEPAALQALLRAAWTSESTA